MRDWKDPLRRLHAQIWVPVRPSGGYGLGVPVVQRALTPSEWESVQEILTTVRPPVCMGNTNFGFGCGIGIYDFPPPPIYPGVPQVEPDLLLLVSQDQLPLPEGRGRVSFDAGWETFSPFTHNERNIKLLKECGLPKPHPKGYYVY